MSEPNDARGRSALARTSYVVFAALLSSCVVLTTLPRAVVQNADGTLVVRSIPCSADATAIKPARDVASSQPLDPRALRAVLLRQPRLPDMRGLDDVVVDGNDLRKFP